MITHFNLSALIPYFFEHCNFFFQLVMTHLLKLRVASAIKWVLSNSIQNSPKLSKTTFPPTWLFPIFQNHRFYGQNPALVSVDGQNLDNRLNSNSQHDCKLSASTRRKAEAALQEYLHSTRSLDFFDAESISRNSPRFLEKLMEAVGDCENENVEHSVTRFLRYHPVNEFEPFFESMGLKPCEYISFLPRHLLYLCDDKSLLDNYHVLCGYGIARNRIGKIYKEAKEVFTYGHGVLESKLQSLKKLGFNKFTVGKLVATCPYLLNSGLNEDVVKVFEKLETFSIDHDWIRENIFEEDSYNWSRMLKLLCLFRKLGNSNEQVGGLLCKHPKLLFEDSGSITIALIGFLLKFRASPNDILSMFLHFPEIQVKKYASNFRRSCDFLLEMKMDFRDIGGLVRAYPILLSSCYLKKVKTVQRSLHCRKRRLREIINKNPHDLKNWVSGSRIKPIPASNKSMLDKTKFLLGLGFVENTWEMRKALKKFQGNGEELQERFDFLVKAGLDREDVLKLLKVSPQTINQSKEALESKIDFIVNDLGLPVYSVVAYPSFLSYTIQRVNLRVEMYKWLQDEGALIKELTLPTIMACSDASFIRQRVSLHPKGREVWEQLKKQIYSN